MILTKGNGLKYSLIFRSEKEKDKKRYDIVGPGTYDPLLPGKFTLPAFSFSYKANPKDMDNRVPGPGTYPKEERFEEMTEQEIKIKNRLELKSEKEKFRFYKKIKTNQYKFILLI